MTSDVFRWALDPTAAAQQARQASVSLKNTASPLRSQAIMAIATAIKRHQTDLLDANTLDLEASREMAVPHLILDWLRLTPERIQSMVQVLNHLSALPDPLGRSVSPFPSFGGTAQSGGSHHSGPGISAQWVPVGVVALIYEAFPDWGAIAAAMALKTGNSVILKGGSEASHSNSVIGQAIQEALAEVAFPEGCVQILAADHGTLMRELVTQEKDINLVIPYGRPNFVQQVTRQATLPVIRPTMGNCYLYWASSGTADMVRWMISDSHQSDFGPVSAIEKVLVHANHSTSTLSFLFNALRDKGFELRGDPDLGVDFPDLRSVEPAEWKQPYLRKVVAFKRVETLEAAIAWMTDHSHGHVDCLATESYSESRRFASLATSSLTYINASPRFQRHPPASDALFLGIASQKGHRRGPIGLEAFTTVKQTIQG